MDAGEHILAREDGWQHSIEARDRGAAAEFLAPDYALVVTNPESVVMSREEWLRLLPDYHVSAYDVQDRSAEIRNGVGVVVQRVEMTAVVAGADRSGVFVLVDVWIEDTGVWRVWRRYSTPLSAGALPRG